MIIQFLLLVASATATRTKCPFHAKTTKDALRVLSSSTRCSFLSLSFNPNDDEILKLAAGIRKNVAVQSLYLSPDFVLESDDDGRIVTLLNAVKENFQTMNEKTSIKTLGLWHERTNKCTKKSSRLLVSSLASLLQDPASKLTSVSIQQHPLTTMDVAQLGRALSTQDSSSGMETLSFKVTDDTTIERDVAMSSLFAMVRKRTESKNERALFFPLNNINTAAVDVFIIFFDHSFFFLVCFDSSPSFLPFSWECFKLRSSR